MMILRLDVKIKTSLDQLCPVPLLGGKRTTCPGFSNLQSAVRTAWSRTPLRVVGRDNHDEESNRQEPEADIIITVVNHINLN